MLKSGRQASPASARPRDSTRLAVVTLLVNTGLMNAGFTMLIPLISVHFTADYGMSGAAVGAVLAVRQFTQQGFMMFGGALGDRWGHKPVMAAGYLVRALGFVWFGLATTLPALVGAAVVTALGGTLFEATGKAALAALVPPERRAGTFSLAALAGGCGLAVGPLLGVVLLRVDFLWVGLAAAGCFVVACLLAAIVLPPTSGGADQPSIRTTLALVMRDGPFVRFTVVLSAYWFLVNQIYISVPLQALRIGGDAGLVGAIFTVQAVAAILLQVPLVRLTSHWLAPTRAIALAVALMGLSLGALALAHNAVLVVLCALGYAIGRVVVEPTRDTLTAAAALPGSAAAYFGFGFLALAFGGTLGNLAGGALMDVANAPSLAWLPWAVFAAVGLVGAGAMSRLKLASL